MDDVKIDKGNYCLIIFLNKTININIGAKGKIIFNNGYYVYVGSALSSLSKRIIRHLSDKKKKHWHVDYLLLNKNTKIEQVIYTYSSKKIECNISSYLNKYAINYIDGFGCSDCNCESHLYYFDSFDDALQTSIDAYEKNNFEAKMWMD